MTIQEKIDLLQQKLGKIKTLHPEKTEWFTFGEKWSAEQVKEFEEKHNITLPEEYKQYLMQLGNGGAGKAWHGTCDCGKIWPPEGEENLRKMGKSFPFEDSDYTPHAGWIDLDIYSNLEDADPADYESLYGLPEGANYEDGALQLGSTTDHEAFYLVVNSKKHAGEVWIDSIGDEGDFSPSGKGFLDYCLDDLDKMTEKLEAKNPAWLP